MNLRLLQRRTVWCPTLLGWVGFLVMVTAPLLLWWFKGESFLATTQRQPADVLVVEGWIGVTGVRAAKAEFETGGYRYIVAAGGLTNNRWGPQQWNYATEAYELLLRLGLPAEKVIEAQAREGETQRTFQIALGVRSALEKHAVHLQTVNVFTLGVHSRRSRLILAKVLGSDIKVGAISWTPPTYRPGPWWKSSERSEDLIKETVGYLFELLLNSGRISNAPDQK